VISRAQIFVLEVNEKLTGLIGAIWTVCLWVENVTGNRLQSSPCIEFHSK